MSAFLPMWIIGVPLVLAVVDFIRTPKPTSSSGFTSAGPGSRVTPV